MAKVKSAANTAKLAAKPVIAVLDIVTLLEDIPQHRLHRGQLGTVVEILSSGAYEVEFADPQDHGVITLALRTTQFTVLPNQPSETTLH